jgi:penicillin V acylase-like amidase (Ntn superfamily)
MCTRIFWSDNPIAHVVSRTMDWNVSDEVEMWLLPAGMVRNEVHGEAIGAHFAFEDASGDSAIVEVLDGKQVVHHGREFTVMANDPTYDEQLAHLRGFAPFGGDTPLPGDITSMDRFVRASYFLHYLPEPKTDAEAVAGVIRLARNVAVPYGAPYPDFGVYPTLWISASDIDHRVFYFESTRSPDVVWVELGPQDLESGRPVRRLDPMALELVGEVSGAFTEAMPIY